MRVRRAIGVCVVLWVGAVLASADPFTDAMGEFHDDVVAVQDGLPEPVTREDRKQARAMKKLVKLLGKPSPSLAKDVKAAGKVAKLVLKLGAGDPLHDDFGDAVAALRVSVAEPVAEVAARIAELPDGKLKIKAQAKLQKATSFLDQAQDPADWQPFLKALKKALRKYGPALAILLKAEDRVDQDPDPDPDPDPVDDFVRLDSPGRQGFGEQMALDGDTLLVGAHSDGARVDPGVGAYVYTRTPEGWERTGALVDPMETNELDQFGISVALSGDTAAVAAYPDDELPPTTNVPWVSLFERNGDVWTLTQRVEPPLEDLVEWDTRLNVALDGDTLVVGAEVTGGLLYVFERGDQGSWARAQTIERPEHVFWNGVFGWRVAIRGDRLLTSSSTRVPRGHLFERVDGIWRFEADLTVPTDSAFDGTYYIPGVALGDGVAVVACHEASQGNHNGVAGVFRLDGDTWVLEQDLAAASSNTSWWGASAAIHGGAIVIGAINERAVHLLERDGGSWSETRRIEAPQLANELATFGSWVVLDSEEILVGDPRRNAVFVFER